MRGLQFSKSCHLLRKRLNPNFILSMRKYLREDGPAECILKYVEDNMLKMGNRSFADRPSDQVMEKLESGFRILNDSKSTSLIKKHLSKDIFNSIKCRLTPYGCSLLDCINSGVQNLDSGIGIYASDPEAYHVFEDIFNPIIEEYHNGFGKDQRHPPEDWRADHLYSFTNVDESRKYVVSTRIRTGRNMQGYPFNPAMKEHHYRQLEICISNALKDFKDDFRGQYYPLLGMKKDVQQRLIDDHFLFKQGDRFLQAAHANDFWPIGRGIFYNDEKTFLVWVNEEDHLRIISMQPGGDIGEVYRRLYCVVQTLQEKLRFERDDRLGFLAFCPTNLGTAMRASVHIKLPKLAANKAKLEEVATQYNLQVRGTRGEHSDAEGGIYDVSNKQRMGLTEYQCVKTMQDGIKAMIKLEESL